MSVIAVSLQEGTSHFGSILSLCERDIIVEGVS